MIPLQATMKQQLSQNWKFHIPDLKVGTLDQLVGLSDDLGKEHFFKNSSINRMNVLCNLHKEIYNIIDTSLF